MTEIQKVKQETRERLIKLGYNEKAVDRLVNSFWRVVGYNHGVPSRVITTEGQEIYL